MWVTEALFPNYLFARFDWQQLLRRVCHAPGVAGVIHFGNHWPTIPDDSIAGLRAVFGENELYALPSRPCVGDEVEIAGGAFHGLRAVVTQAMPARKRVTVLLDFLGRQTSVEVPVENVLRDDARTALL